MQDTMGSPGERVGADGGIARKRMKYDWRMEMLTIQQSDYLLQTLSKGK